ncbi:hypothetical protein SMACR_02714 [Sordaria macrospora]|uniref:Uncharacterized protein n=1 Tax=Sordaria macrospora TaxID=5147 RepID=A0A8S9A3C2_SORMA|nr:hypothetical protein SMACR_02714 [Sordaria macrospora]WPJ60456.1 hypothetical protein SMAC4_02714 [Sordaria macrospora]
MVCRSLCERIKITVGGGGGSGGGGHRQQQYQHQQSSSVTTTSGPATKVFFLHKRLLCEYSEYFSTALSPRNRDVFVEAETGHFVFDDDDDDPDDFYRWAVWLYVCSGCKLSAIYEFQNNHRCSPSRLEEFASKSDDAAGEGEGEREQHLYAPYGLPQHPPCMSLSDQTGVDRDHWRTTFNVIAATEEEGEPADIRRDEAERTVRLHMPFACKMSSPSPVTGWFCARDSGEGDSNAAKDPNAALEAAAAYMFGYRILSRAYRLFALAHFIQHVDLLTEDYQDELQNLLHEVFPVGSEAHRFLTVWVAWLRWKQRLPNNDEPGDRSRTSGQRSRETDAFFNMFQMMGYRKGSEAADPRRYPLFHWEQECSKGLPGDRTYCDHTESLQWHGSVVNITEQMAPNLLPPMVTNAPPSGRSSTRPLATGDSRWEIFFGLSKDFVTFWSQVLWLWGPFIILAFAADTFAQDKHHLIEFSGKVLGAVFAAMVLLAAWYKYPGWEWVIGLTMLLGVPKACGSFIWAQHCFEKAAAAAAQVQGEIDEVTSPRLCKEETALGAFELLFVASVFWTLLNTKHDVHPAVAKPEKASWGCRAARPEHESFVRRALQAIWKEKDLLWWSCVTLWHMASISVLVIEPIIWAKDHNSHNSLVEMKIHALLCAILGIVTAWYMAKGCRIVFLASTFLQLIFSNVSGIAEVSPCFRRARDREVVDVGNEVCKLQAGLASAMLVHLVLSICILVIWRNAEHPTRGILRALRAGRRARKEEQTVAVESSNEEA